MNMLRKPAFAISKVVAAILVVSAVAFAPLLSRAFMFDPPDPTELDDYRCITDGNSCPTCESTKSEEFPKGVSFCQDVDVPAGMEGGTCVSNFTGYKCREKFVDCSAGLIGGDPRSCLNEEEKVDTSGCIANVHYCKNTQEP
jgi:hypothetical protein